MNDKQTQLEQMASAEKSFKDFMDIIKHEDAPFAEKQEIVEAYKQAYPLWPMYNRMLQEALDAINPAYAGMSRWLICGVLFYVQLGEWQETDGIARREDVYLHVETGLRYTLSYGYYDGHYTIALDNVPVRVGTAARSTVPEMGVDQLLIRLNILPF